MRNGAITGSPNLVAGEGARDTKSLLLLKSGNLRDNNGLHPEA
jgi:hypothetical protein